MDLRQNTQTFAAAIERDRSILRNVYLWMTLGLALTGVVALYVAGNPDLLRALVLNRMVFFGLILGEFALVFFLSARIMTMSPSAATLSFAGYSILK